MILKDIIYSYAWTPYGIVCPDVNSMKLAHKFLREAILDRHLYVCKVIGFEIKSNVMSRAHAGTYIARHKQIAESYPEIMLNLQDKVFLTPNSKDLQCELKSGENKITTVGFMDADKNPVPALYTREDICRVIDKTCTLKLKVVYDCGYRYCQQNSKKVGSECFPSYTDFSVHEFFRILPPEPSGTTINLRYYNGATEASLKQLLAQYWSAIQSGSLRKEEREWLQNFMR